MERPGGAAARDPAGRYGVIMLEWLQSNPWSAWLALAAVLAISEMFTLDLTLLMLAVGALAGVAIGFVLPDLLWVQVVAAVVVALACLGLVRPEILKKVQRGQGYRSSIDQVVGSAGVVVREVTSTDGEVKINGEAWSARSYDGEPITVGVEIEVFEINGVTALVYPRHRPLPGA